MNMKSKITMALALVLLGASTSQSAAYEIAAAEFSGPQSVPATDGRLYAQADTTKSAASSSESGPKIDTTDDDKFLKVTEDENGLQRVGTFGKMHFFGYGEMHYNGKMGATPNDIDFHRLVLGFGYDFTERARFRAELDFEHAFTEPELEYAYVEFDIKEWMGFRAGAVLIPLGTYNEHHEPPLFYSVERPELYRAIIPTTWQEAGVGIYGTVGKGLEYKLYVVSSLSAATVEGGAITRSFTGSSGYRGGRNRVAEAEAHDFGVTGRLQYTGVPGLRLGTSFFAAPTGQGNGAIGSAFLTLLEADVKYAFEGIELEGVIAYSKLSGADNLNAYLVGIDPIFTDFAGSSMLGWYVEAAYHLFHHVMPETKHDLIAFVRYEDFNTQFSMPAGFAANPANNRNTVTAGISYKPIPQVAFKADYMMNWNKLNGGVDQFNLGVGFYY
jgi:hypothetical protein